MKLAAAGAGGKEGNVWERLSDSYETIGTEEAKVLEAGGILMDIRGEVCPYPMIKAKEGLARASSGQVVVVYTDHVDAVATVPLAVKDIVSKIKVWKSGKGEYKIFLWKA
jgi:TusA-related sulfurtransferase